MSNFVRNLLKRNLNTFSREVYLLSSSHLVQRGIMTTPAQRAKEAVDALKGNPYLEKYAKKIADLQKTSPEELLARIDAFEKSKNKSVKKTPLDNEREFSAPMAPKAGHGSGLTKPKLLEEVMKIDLIKDKSPEEITQIWSDYHKSKDVIAATIPAETFDKIYKRSLDHPTFLLALPRSKGYEFIVCQFSGNEIHFTPLISYQTHKENSPECLTVIHYVDIKEEKKIVLMKGEFNKDILNVTEAQCLANQIQLYYGQDDEKRLQILDRFTNKPLEFKHMELVAQLECLSI